MGHIEPVGQTAEFNGQCYALVQCQWVYLPTIIPHVSSKVNYHCNFKDNKFFSSQIDPTLTYSVLKMQKIGYICVKFSKYCKIRMPNKRKW